MSDRSAAIDDDAFAEQLAEIDSAIQAGESLPEQISPRVRRGLAAIEALRGLRDPGSTIVNHAGPTLGPSTGTVLPTRLGRFHILKELGRGGFGVVFLARDPQLHREVALKVPHAGALLDPHLRERFLREARAAAGLNHPNIIAVHEVDEAGPIVAIVSAYCPGMTLAQWLTRQKSQVAPRLAAKLVSELADGVAHAHSRGVLHRDLKPANVMLLTEAEVKPKPMIADFGLAKLADEQGAATKTGAILGTPSYMSPEQARGKPTDERGDVYGLGAILYELLVGRPPHCGESDVETLQLVTNVEPVAPRQLRPKLPRDLETICLKCLEKEPARRYGSASELRDDLTRFLAGETVLARPVPRVVKLARWCRRKPLVAGLSAGLVAAIGLGAAGVTKEFRRANRERDEAVAARLKSDRVLARSRESLQRMIDFGQSNVHDPGMVPTTIHILKMAREYYAKLAAEDPTNHEMRAQAATICRRLGIIYEYHGTAEQLDEALGEAKRLTEALMLERPEETDYRVEMFEICQTWVKALINRGEFDRADALLNRSLEIIEADAAVPTRKKSTVIALALSIYHRGEIRRKRGDLDGAIRDFRQAIAIHEPVDAVNDPAEFIRYLTATCLRCAMVLIKLERYEEAEPLVLKVRQRLDQTGDRLSDSDYRELSTNVDGYLARIRMSQGRWAEAEALFDKATGAMIKHVADSEPRRGYHMFVCRNAWMRARALDKLGRGDDAEQALRVALDLRPPEADAEAKMPAVEYFECYLSLLERLRDRPNERESIAQKARAAVEPVADWPSHADVVRRLRAVLSPG